MNKLSLSYFVGQGNNGLSFLVAFTLILVAILHLLSIPSFTEQIFSLKELIDNNGDLEGLGYFFEHDMIISFGTIEQILGVPELDTSVNDEISVTHTRSITDGIYSEIRI